MKDSGKAIRKTDSAGTFTLIKASTLGTITMTNPMVLEFIAGQMETSTRVNGKTESEVALESSNSRSKIRFISESSSQINSRARDTLSTVMAHFTKVDSELINAMDSA